MSPRNRSRTIHLDIQGIEELIRKLKDPRLATVPLYEMLEAGAKLGQETAREAVTGGTNRARVSILYKVWAHSLKARVYTMIAKPRALQMDPGRRVGGEGITINQTAAWHFKSLYRDDWDMSPEQRSTVAKKWKSMRRFGSKGKKYIVTTREVLLREMPRLQDKAMRRLEELANR